MPSRPTTRCSSSCHRTTPWRTARRSGARRSAAPRSRIAATSSRSACRRRRRSRVWLHPGRWRDVRAGSELHRSVRGEARRGAGAGILRNRSGTCGTPASSRFAHRCGSTRSGACAGTSLRRASAPTGRAGATARSCASTRPRSTSCPADSIDYAVMERIIASPAPPEAVVVRLDAQWTDVGAWDALWQIGEKDAHGNVVHGDVHLADTAQCAGCGAAPPGRVRRARGCGGRGDARRRHGRAQGPRRRRSARWCRRSRRRAAPRPSRTARCTAPGAPTTASKAASASR